MAANIVSKRGKPKFESERDCVLTQMKMRASDTVEGTSIVIYTIMNKGKIQSLFYFIFFFLFNKNFFYSCLIFSPAPKSPALKSVFTKKALRQTWFASKRFYAKQGRRQTFSGAKEGLRQTGPFPVFSVLKFALKFD